MPAHSVHVKYPASESLTASANACACHGSANTGPPSSRGMRGNPASRSLDNFGSGVFKVVVPHVEMNGVALRGLFAPELARGKANGIDVLRLLADELRVRVGK